MTATYNDILESLQRTAIILLVYIIFRTIYLCVKRNTFNLKTELVYAAFAVYATEMVCRLLFPYCRLPIMSTLTSFKLRELRDIKPINLIPFKTIYLYTFGVDNRLAETWYGFKFNFWTGHFMLSVPMGIFMQLLSNTKRKKITYKKAATIAFLFFTAVEIIQYPIGRVADIDDIIINTLGCMLGYWLYNVYEKHKESRTALVSNAA